MSGRNPLPKTAAMLLALAVSALACAPSYHRAQRYRFDHAEADLLEAQAVTTCEAALAEAAAAGESVEAEPPSRSFATDGCTWWFDGLWTGRSWQACCVKHDIDYWCGGTRGMRCDSDRELQQCVASSYSGWMGAVMRFGTRIFGHPLVPAHWRWGFGRDYPAGY